MLKPWFLRLHRWIALTFALPLLVVIVTGLFLSFPPILQNAYLKPGTVTLQKMESLLDQHDPQNRARSVRIDWFQNVISIGNDVDVDISTGATVDEDHWLSEIMSASRGIHQRLVYDLGWLVTASTAAMLVIILLGTFLGLPRLSNSVSGWHKATAWFLLPLLALSPLTALFMAAGITLSSPPERSQPLPLREALRVVAASHDLSTLEWLRMRGPRQLVRISDGSNQSTYLVTREGLQPASTNLPRTFHEGTFWGIWGGVMNVVLSLAFLGLLGTGFVIWLRRRLRPRRRVRGPALAASASLQGAAPKA
ncbi:MAG: PepSY domain-containing protein [Beijerinckiaceae bacterium]|nr:PepSY domain-containing protein [Beijerinckiaceae bacterium]